MSLTDDEKRLPKWAQERLQADEAMGEMRSSATAGEAVLGVLLIAFEIGVFIGGCVLVFLIGRCVVGS